MASRNSGKKEFWIIVFILYGILFAVFFAFKGGDVVFLKNKFNIGALLIITIMTYTATSLGKVGPGEIGAVLFIGKPLFEIRSGFVFVPRFLFELRKGRGTVIPEQYPEEPENIWKGDQDQIEGKKGPTGKPMVPPMRVTHSSKPLSEKKKVIKITSGVVSIVEEDYKTPQDDPINKRMTTEISVFIRYRISNFITFITTIGTVEDARSQMRDAVEGLIKKELAQRTPGQTLEDWGYIDYLLWVAINETVASWGVIVESTRMVDVDLGRTVNVALRDIPTAILAADKIRIEADANEYKLEHEGIGKGKAYKEIKERAGVDGSTVVASQTAEEMMKNSDYSLISGSSGISDIYKIVAGIQGVLPNITEKAKSASAKKTKSDDDKNKNGGVKK